MISRFLYMWVADQKQIQERGAGERRPSALRSHSLYSNRYMIQNDEMFEIPLHLALMLYMQSRTACWMLQRSLLKKPLLILTKRRGLENEGKRIQLVQQHRLVLPQLGPLARLQKSLLSEDGRPSAHQRQIRLSEQTELRPTQLQVLRPR